ncbi:hypothetical protein D3C87_1720730 [compost metagenome]
MNQPSGGAPGAAGAAACCADAANGMAAVPTVRARADIAVRRTLVALRFITRSVS